MPLATARVSMPDVAKPGEIIEIKALIRHPMETGYRVDAVGQPIPRQIITRFTVHYDDEQIFAMHLTQGVAANPFIAFTTVAVTSGELIFRWHDDRENVTTVRRQLRVAE